MTADDLIGVFLQEMEQHGRSERTLDAYERVLTQFVEYLENNRSVATSEAVANATREDCLAWVHQLRMQYSDSTIASYAAYVNRFYRYMNAIGHLDANPMTIVMDGLEEGINTDPTRRELTVDDLRRFISTIQHPLDRAVVMLLAKTGIRVGELSNLDLRDIELSQIDIDAVYEVMPRGQLAGRGPSMFIASQPRRNHTYNNDIRLASNKRERDTIIPIDRELEYELCRWLAIRPDTQSAAEPLFASTKHNWGERISPDQIRHIIREHAEAVGWYQTGADAGENITPHYFRHFFTTHLRDRTGDRGVVKYLRGDVADDIIDTYTHNWGDRVQETYHRAIYSLK